MPPVSTSDPHFHVSFSRAATPRARSAPPPSRCAVSCRVVCLTSRITSHSPPTYPQMAKAQAKSQKYDPDAPVSTLAIQDQALAHESERVDHTGQGFRLNTQHLSRDQLRARLAQRISELRSRQGAPAEAARDWKEKQLHLVRQGGVTKDQTAKDNHDKRSKNQSREGAVGAKNKQETKKEEKEKAELGVNLTYQVVDDGEGKRKKKLTKEQALEKAVAEKEKVRLRGLIGDRI